MMKRKWFIFLIPIGIVVFTFVGGEVVKNLWNWLLPNLFGFKQITFWQAIGLLALCRILFGGTGMSGHSRSHAKRRADERWEKMTPEEREKFRHGFHGRWQGDAPPDPKTSA